MKVINRFLLLTLFLATPVFAQVYDPNTLYPTGTCTTTPGAMIGISRYTRSAYSQARNTVSCTGTFNGNVTGTVAIQFQYLYLQNIQNQAEGKLSVADTFYSKSRTWPVLGNNPNCTYSSLYTSCPPGEDPYIVTDPIPTAATIYSTTSGSQCFRAVTDVSWKETTRYFTRTYTRTRTVKAYSAWAGSNCVQ